MSKLVKYFGVNIKKGDYIFREGDPADFMYMIHKGRVQISKGIGTFDEKIRILGEGEFIGEMAVINSMPRSANALAVEDCVLIKMDRESFDKTVQKNHEFSVSVIQLLSDRLRETDEMLMVYAKNDRVQRLYSMVLAEMITEGKRDGSGQWCLLNRDAFVRRAMERLKWERNSILSVLAELVAMERLRVKKDRGGSEWIAFKID
ncbi:MAG TPA: cyclic nucleotide-binding domain-containing protein [Spirochaetota bacterium]|nr:cyclic nucleotide-binding domain-containing protein [Spirochaetota bacterium]HPC41559.1 cyclic nucleotide-binding domain-containing protein [Spirochaetota bacterium]HPL16957.1 cyclic nucleotide-binding domain-containing protein [Spirochaetota bacterium]HQF09072.1 cyclic nucleotide-binding domain-containing protein [Spirochaetota bacterium]HQH97703.1 cyclic nucleotide-binding domain-containing protein [Spirochaetota bacterium]